jgi:hypothetical protein
MVRTHRFSTTALIVCFALAQWRGTLVASEQPPSTIAPPLSPAVVNVVEEEPDATSTIALAADVTNESLSGEAILPLPVERPRLKLPVEIFHEPSSSFAQRGGYRGGGRGGRNDAARAAIVLGAVAAIAGTSVLVYANRPECSANARASGCGYGTKVVGTAVLSGGIVALVVGALTWR